MDCPYCNTSLNGRVAMAGGDFDVDGVITRVKTTIYFRCDSCDDGFYHQR